MNKLLFPNWVQKVSMGVCIICVIFIFTTLYRSAIKDIDPDRLYDTIPLIILYLSVFCCIFSREKREDEYISNMRLKAVATVAFIAFFIIIVLNIIQISLPLERFDAMKEWRKDHFWNGNFIIDLAILYFLVFKFSISRKS